MIVTGSDQKCHLYEFNPALQRYCSIDDGFVQPIFPELVDEFDSIPMWISVFYKNNKRITAIGKSHALKIYDQCILKTN